MDELDRFRDALRLTDMAFLPLLAASEASLAEQTQTAITLDRQMAQQNHTATARPGHAPELAVGSQDAPPIIFDIVAHFGRANQALTHALNLAGVARADLIWRLEAARSNAVELLAELKAARTEAAELAQRAHQADLMAAELQALRSQLREATARRDAMQRLSRQRETITANWHAGELVRRRLQETVNDLSQKNSVFEQQNLELSQKLLALEEKAPELERDILFLKQKSPELEHQNQLFHARNVQIARFTRYIPAPLKYIVRHLIFRSRSAP